MQLSVLGPLSVEATVGQVGLGGPQVRRLLAALAVHCPDPVSKDTLEDLLWPHGAPSANALQAQVSKLRKTLSPTEINGSASGYSLRVDRSSVDAHQFEQLVADGRNAAANGEPARALSQFADALAMWRGTPYGEAADHFVAHAASTRLTSLRTAALTGKLEAELALGRLDDVGSQLDALVHAEPLVEPWWALLMLTRYRQNRQVDALRAFADARRALASEVGLEPGPELRQLEQRILRHDPDLMSPAVTSTGVTPTGASAGPGDAHRVRLPERLSSFIGRTSEMTALEALVRANRLVTLLGPGGSGKTSTAIEFARQYSASLGGIDIHLVELASLSGAGEIVAGVARALGVPDIERAVSSQNTDDFQRLADMVGSRPMLLIADNCEHVIDDIAALVHTLLTRCGGVRVVATSREPLDVPGEALWRIPPLSSNEASELFAARAAAAGSGFELDPVSAEGVAALVGHLDYLPLAIELAAARMRSLTLDELIDRIDNRFELLSSGPRTVEPRQQTLRAVVDWSYDLLDDDERTVFRRLAVCAGGASRAAATAICADAALPASDVWDVVERLAHKSLVTFAQSPTGTRTRMLQTLYDYALGKLADSDETEAMRRRHAEFFAAMISPAERGLMNDQQAQWLAAINVERDNLTVAFEHALAWGDAELAIMIAGPMGWYFFMIGEMSIGAQWLRQAISCPGRSDPRRRSHALGLYSWLAVTSADIASADEAAGEALRSLGTYDDPWTECMVASTYVMTHLYLGHVDECVSTVHLATAAAARAGERWSTALTMILEAEIAVQTGDIAVAERGYAAAIDALSATGDQFLRAVAVTQAVELAEARGEYDWAVRTLEEMVVLAGNVGFSISPIAVETRLASLEMLRGHLALAAAKHMSVLHGPAAAESPWLQAMSLTGLAAIARRRGDPGAAADLLDQALRIPRTQAVPLIRSVVQTARGYTADQLGDAETALRCQKASLSTVRLLRGKRSVANAVEGLAGAHVVSGHPVLAARLLGYADALRRSAGGPMPAAERFDVDRATNRARDALREDAFDEQFALGADADFDELIDEALLTGIDSPAPV